MTSAELEALNNHFFGKSPVVKDIYDKILQALREFGAVTEEPKKTSIHLVNSSAAAGIATRKDYLILTVKSNKSIESPRIKKVEKVSSNRFHLEIRLDDPKQVDEELSVWLRDAYAISG